MLTGTVLGIDIFRTLVSSQMAQKEERDERLVHSKWFCLRNCLRAAIGTFFPLSYFYIYSFWQVLLSKVMYS